MSRRSVLLLLLVLSAGTAGAQRRRRPLTDELLRTAFRDDAARALFTHARLARRRQELAVDSYAARAHQRVDLRLGIGSAGVSRPGMREESVFDVRWRDSIGARVRMEGARVGVAAMPGKMNEERLQEDLLNGTLSPIPFYRNQDALWAFGPTARADVNDRVRVNPLADGSEAYYTFEVGDSIGWTLPRGERITLRELRMRPRSPEWNLAVGSLWCDVETGSVVRAAYRFATPADAWVSIGENARERGSGPPRLAIPLIKAIASPFRFQVSAVVVEYGLFEGRYWLPRMRSLEGSQQLAFARLDIVVEQVFSYSRINDRDEFPPIVVNAPGTRELRVAFLDSLRHAPCDPADYRVIGQARPELGMPVEISYPCGLGRLARSAAFAAPLYTSNDTAFGAQERVALLSAALPLAAQPALRLSRLFRPSTQYGLSLTRYNRVEGVSTGLGIEQQLGAGFSVSTVGRIGSGDRRLNVEVALTRSGYAATAAAVVYDRLVAANDWGDPLSFGASLSALLFGRDDGFYYRARGGELRRSTGKGTSQSWRIFAEQQRQAARTIGRSFGGAFTANVGAAAGSALGVGFRLFSDNADRSPAVAHAIDARVEGATGTWTYARSAVDVTLSVNLPARFASSLTMAGGATAGSVPPQRYWFLGGAHTVRGQTADTARSGNSFWLVRGELGRGVSLVRVAVFGDVGWVGDRSRLGRADRPMSGAGIGTSLLNGLARFDVARGIWPMSQTKVYGYVNARF